MSQPLIEGKEWKGGVNPPNTSNRRPPPPGGSAPKKHRPAAVMTDEERLDLLERILTPGEKPVEIYLAGLRHGHAEGPDPWKATGFQVEIQNLPAASGRSLREAIDALAAKLKEQP